MMEYQTEHREFSVAFDIRKVYSWLKKTDKMMLLSFLIDSTSVCNSAIGAHATHKRVSQIELWRKVAFSIDFDYICMYKL